MENTLVVYNKFQGEIQKFVQEAVLPISELNPENRVVVDQGMYIASCRRLELEPSGFYGILRIKYLKEILESDKDHAENLWIKIKKVFVPKSDIGTSDTGIIEYDDKLYKEMWEIETDRGWITSHGSVYGEALGKLKAVLYTKKKLLLANEFLMFLTEPVTDSLLKLHREIGNF